LEPLQHFSFRHKLPFSNLLMIQAALMGNERVFLTLPSTLLLLDAAVVGKFVVSRISRQLLLLPALPMSLRTRSNLRARENPAMIARILRAVDVVLKIFAQTAGTSA